ncbi:hypothetical protein CANCADRAFT_22162 [Tortispora caseinolytica NRRL Y-17796]|uniref:SPX domain-containing protein n=1 Tax=Tortispora caseinolytica NRRL Y-17796 TaxID=767744 RepID=A0A1E4TJI4_9ASCO|nr:hypothetical protein CANCADRAFT_22162 [Tortispora caseinolytica NRRL Y-17796]
MKFSHSVQFNAVPEWSSQYIAYSNLKKLLFNLEKEYLLNGNEEERERLISSGNPDTIYIAALDAELKKVSDFYTAKEAEILAEYDKLSVDFLTFTENPTESNNRLIGVQSHESGRPFVPYTFRDHSPGHASLEGPSEPTVAESHEQARGLSISPTRKSMKRRSSARLSVNDYEGFIADAFNDMYDHRIHLKKRIIQSFVQLSELSGYVQLNETGFRKATKKYDKILGRSIRENYLTERVAHAYPFLPETRDKISQAIQNTIQMYSNLLSIDFESAKVELKMHLREYVVWERNTVWRDMIDMERKTQAARLGAQVNNSAVAPPKRWKIGSYYLPLWMTSSSTFSLVLIVCIFVLLLNVKIFEEPAKRNCLAILITASLLWATEAMPLFATAMLIPFLVVLLNVIVDANGKPLPAPDAASYIFSSMWSSMIMLLLGGFAIAAALSKYQIAKLIATATLSKSGTDPKWVLLAIMFISMVASMFISNVAAPVLCISVVQPILRNLSPDSKFSKALLLGIAFASNVGGMTSPIASPQNIVALQNMDPQLSWISWFAISIPVSLISLLLIWAVLLVSCSAERDTVIAPIRVSSDKFSSTQVFVCAVTIGTIILWCLTHALQPFVGDMGVVALIPLVVFFGTKTLTSEDFNNFLWTVVMLAMGGIALGKAVSSSGLLADIAATVDNSVQGMHLYGITIVFGAVVLVVATFISHTVAALIFLPLVKEVGESLDNPHPRLLVMLCALLCSAAMGLPTSGFPNVTAICTMDEMGRPYLNVKLFITRGVPISVIVFGVVTTVGYTLMQISGL